MWRTSLPHAPGANVQWTTYVYDARGRTIQVWKPDGSITHYSYAGNVTTVTDPAGKWKKFTYDAQNNLVMVTEPDPANGNNTLTTNYSYNAANQLLQVTMTRGTVTQTRTFQWTGSNLTQSTNPENGTVTYTYDGAHHVTQRVDAKGQRTTYGYDVYGRLTQVRHYDASNNEQPGQDVDYGYDNPYWNAWGRLSNVSFGGGTYEYEYNTAGRVTAHRLVQSGGTTEADYQWDNRGRMTQMSGVDTLNYQYDAMSRLVGMTDANNATVATAQYDQNSQLLELDWGGFREVRQYNQLQQMTRMTTTQPLGGTTLMDMQYIYVAGANNGRVTETLDGVTGDTQTFGYDALNRLVSVTSSLGNNESMAYDGFGNLTSMNGVSYTVDATTNRRTGGDGTTTYDANGNVTQWGQAGYGWDIENRMTSNGAAYDPWGKRVAVGTQVYFYSLSGQRLTGPNGVNRYFGGKLIQSNGVGVATDRLGSVRANGNGERMVYTAYGTERTSTADGKEKFGTYFRDATGLDYADQRYYGHEGMFLSPDPYKAGKGSGIITDPTSWNRYAYVGGDPINFIDPTGNRRRCVGPSDDETCWDEDDEDAGNGPGGPDVKPPWNEVANSGSGGAVATAGPDPSAVYTKAVFSAIAALKDPGCASIFNTDPNVTKTDPASVFASMAFGGSDSVGSITFDKLPLADAAITDYDHNNYVSTGAGVKTDSATIKLQSSKLSNAYYGGQSVQDLALTLIHELGHVYNMVSGLGGSKIVWDNDPITQEMDPDAEARNEKTLQACHPGG
jgi:RHS repeat-associated protein